jgi:hypothetical protein
MKKRSVLSVIAGFGLLLPGLANAIDTPEKLVQIEAKTFRHSGLNIESRDLELKSLTPAAAAEVKGSLARLGAAEASARIDSLSGRFSTLMPAVPLVPGSGVGNNLAWDRAAVLSRTDRESIALDAFLGYLGANRAQLGINMDELKGEQRTASHDGDIYQFHLGRTIDGIPVRGSYIAAAINHGNLVLMTTHAWGDRPAKTSARQISQDAARAAVYEYLGALDANFEAKGSKLYLTMADAAGYRYPLVWAFTGKIAGDGGNWEALVDAYSGEILSFEDQNHYAEAKGGVYPVTNDGVAPDGVEQAGWPMPWLTVTGGTTDTGGNASVSGSLTSNLSGPYIRMVDNCGSISLTQTNNIDYGVSGGTDCTTPGIGGAGNTHSSRSGFYELNKIKEMARGQLPSNSWLTAQLTSNMNINQTCNAFWGGGTVNFYRSGGGCFNTGEIAGVFDHEWGHGIDDNDVNGNIASPSGEGIADVYTALRLNTSCIGRHFRSTVCTGNGDNCLTCTGVRDIDYQKRVSGNPHTYTWSNSNCGGSVHCVGAVYSEAVWSLWKRKLTAAPFSMDNNTAMEVVTRLTYIGAGNVGTWFSGGPPNGGCAGGSGYNNYLAADDDNGNLNDGTPHMTAIHAAFNDQQIACTTPTVQNSGCSGAPTAAPNVTATAGANSVALSWGAVSGASKYQVFRTEGVFACDFGKVKLGETTGTSFTSANLQNGRPYSYVVVPVGAANTCMGPASACDTATPSGGGGGNNPPTVSITAPANGSSSSVGASVSFTGTATDVEDGSLTGSLAWTSSINGSIGSGGSFSTSSLSAGSHTITASVTDSGGLPGSASISITVNAAAGVLTNGVPVTGLSGATGSNTFFTLAVPAGATNLSFVTSGGSGDADLYVRFGAQPTTTVRDCASESSTNAETCSFATPSTGTYHVLLYGFAAYSGVTLTGSYTAPGGPVTVTFYSVGSQDARLGESGESTNIGGFINSTDNTTSSLRVGDFSDDTQYRSLVSFDTSSIPDTATITAATLRVKRGVLSGTSPFSTHGSCTVDMSSAFGGSTAAAASDFEAAASASGVATMSNPASNGTFSTGTLSAAGRAAVNKTGSTQFKFYMTTDDNDDAGTDYIGFYSGEAAAGNRPELVITYTP